MSRTTIRQITTTAVALVVVLSMSTSVIGVAVAQTGTQVTAQESSQTTAGTNVSLAPANGSEISVNETVTYDVVLGTADSGVGAINYTVSVGNTSVATITDASLDIATEDATLDQESVSIASDNSSVTAEGVASASSVSGSDAVVGTVTVEGANAGEADLDLSVGYVTDVNSNDYTISSVINSSVTVTKGPPTNVTISPKNVTTAQDGIAVVDVVVGNASQGIGAYNFTATVSEESVDFIGGIQPDRGSEIVFDAAVSENNSSIVVSGADQVEPGTDVTIAKLRLKGTQIGSATVNIDFDNGYLTGVNQTKYSVEGTSGSSVTVIASPKAVSQNAAGPPKDIDQDGKYEDVNGDGMTDARDVLSLWNNRDQITETMFFDFNGDEIIDARDVLGLWNQLR